MIDIVARPFLEIGFLNCFLSKEEAQVFAANDQVYLVKDVFQYNFDNITGTNKLKLTSSGMVANWMFYLQRNDVNLRNEWSNYTNWPYLSKHTGWFRTR